MSANEVRKAVILPALSISKYGGPNRERLHIEIPKDNIEDVRSLIDRKVWVILVDIHDTDTTGRLLQCMRPNNNA